MDRRRLRVEGHVQGVGFRDACVEQARSLALAGYVRNQRDGSIEVMLEGPADAVARMVDWLHRGPPRARVVRVTAIPASSADVPMQRFERRPTE